MGDDDDDVVTSKPVEVNLTLWKIASVLFLHQGYSRLHDPNGFTFHIIPLAVCPEDVDVCNEAYFVLRNTNGAIGCISSVLGSYGQLRRLLAHLPFLAPGTIRITYAIPIKEKFPENCESESLEMQ